MNHAAQWERLNSTEPRAREEEQRMRPTMRMKLGATVHSIELGATVRSADGEEVGKIDHLVVDSHTQTIASFILRTGRFHNHGRC